MNKTKVCAVIVTYNRKSLLGRCADAVLNQTIRPDSIMIVDNASTDGTLEHVTRHLNLPFPQAVESDRLFSLGDISGCEVLYCLKSHNEGGAGGFFTGLKTAHECGDHDCYWLMDDDGYPSADCLERQLVKLERFDYVMPVSIDIDNHRQVSWATRMKNGRKTVMLDELRKDWGEELPFIFPFNGSLLSRKIVDKVGYINPKLFIWGDDYEHYYRCLRAGFAPVTLLDAEFYHPVNKAPTVPILFGRIEVPYVDSKLRFVCLIRNWAYIYKTNHKYFKILKNFAAYSWLFLITRKMDLEGYKLYLASFADGLKGNFERHKKYL